MQNSALPSHRDLVTSLITSIAHDHPPSDPSNRPLLLTLHVIFPSLVLPALDLLDRKLITRLTLSPQDKSAKPSSAGPEAQGLIRAYAVQSAASAAATTHRRRDVPPGTARRRYLVHVDAWSCSCAAFALEAYRCAAAGEDGRARDYGSGIASDGLDFGGLSLDGRGHRTDVGEGDGGEDADVPCCKHLLACYLAERWEGGLGAHVETRTVAKEELAAIVAGL